PAPDGAVLTLAGAGTGKTKCLTAAVVHRIRALGVRPHRLLATTFTNKAAAEMTGRIRNALGGDAVPNWIGTCHALGARQLRAEPEIAGLRPGFDILDAEDSRRLVKRVLKAQNLAAEEAQPSGRDPVKLIAGHISRLKDSLVAPDEAQAHIDKLIA